MCCLSLHLALFILLNYHLLKSVLLLLKISIITLKLKCKESDIDISLFARLSQGPPRIEYAVYNEFIHQWDTSALKLYIDLNYNFYYYYYYY